MKVNISFIIFHLEHHTGIVSESEELIFMYIYMHITDIVLHLMNSRIVMVYLKAAKNLFCKFNFKMTVNLKSNDVHIHYEKLKLGEIKTN